MKFVGNLTVSLTVLADFIDQGIIRTRQRFRPGDPSYRRYSNVTCQPQQRVFLEEKRSRSNRSSSTLTLD